MALNSDDYVRTSVQNKKGVLILNRPATMNSVTFNMIK